MLFWLCLWLLIVPVILAIVSILNTKGDTTSHGRH